MSIRRSELQRCMMMNDHSRMNYMIFGVLFNFIVHTIIIVITVPVRLMVGKSERDRMLGVNPVFQRLLHFRKIYFTGYTENYESLYGPRSLYHGKTVLDVGAEVGTTALFFLRCGASRIVAVEGDHLYARELSKQMSSFPSVTPIHRWINDQTDWMTLLSRFHPDIVKCDCEGCERHLLHVPYSVFRIPNRYVMEIHGDLLVPLLRKFTLSSFIIASFDMVDTHMEPCYLVQMVRCDHVE